MSRNIIASPASYRPCWISYNGAMAGLLSSQGVECDVAEVAGRSGYAFIANVIKGRLCASGPTALGVEAWVRIREGTESLGLRLEHWTDFSASSGTKPSAKELEKMRRLFDRIRNEIDNGRPAVLWGIAVPEYGLVNGYEGDAYIVSSYRSAIGIPDDPVKYYELDAPGCYDAYFVKGRNERTETDKEILSRALAFASGRVSTEDGYVHGPRAFQEWSEALRSSPLTDRSYMENSYVGACVQEARGLAAIFLGRMAKRGGGKELEAASKAYQRQADHLLRFIDLFPFAPEVELRAEDRSTGAAMLDGAYELEERAVEAASWSAGQPTLPLTIFLGLAPPDEDRSDRRNGHDDRIPTASKGSNDPVAADNALDPTYFSSLASRVRLKEAMPGALTGHRRNRVTLC